MTMSPISQARFGLMLAISIPIVVTDLRFRRIPNWTCGVLFLAGIVASGFEQGVSGVLWSLGGAVAGLLAFIIFYALGGMGGGDIKLMAACGSVIGLRGMPVALVLAAIIGAVVAVVTLTFGWLRRKRTETIPYAPAIVAGSLLALLGRTG
jgi:prepilin peptidase CpaA